MKPDIELARKNMIDSQVRTWDVLDLRILDTLDKVKREDFVPEAYRHLAFMDVVIPLAHGEVMMKPVVEGRCLQALDLAATDTVLEIGTGSAFLTACMASLAKHVTSIDIHQDFIDKAGQKLEHASINNVSLTASDAIKTYTPSKKFDAVVITGGLPHIEQTFLSWLKPQGRAFLVYGESPVMRASLFHRDGKDQFSEESLFETDLPWLKNTAPEPHFVF